MLNVLIVFVLLCCSFMFSFALENVLDIYRTGKKIKRYVGAKYYTSGDLDFIE